MSLIRLLFEPGSRLSYRRLLAFVVATGLLVNQVIEADTWMVVTAAFIASDGIERVARAMAAMGAAPLLPTEAATPASPVPSFPASPPL